MSEQSITFQTEVSSPVSIDLEEKISHKEEKTSVSGGAKKIIYVCNCQGSAVVNILKEHPSFKDWEHKVYINFDYINKKEPFPVDEFLDCDIFVYQPISGDYHPNHNTDPIVERLKALKKPPLLISFVYLFFLGYTPDHSGNGQDELPYLSRRIVELSHRVEQITEKFGWDDTDPKEARVEPWLLLDAKEIAARSQKDAFLPTPYIKKRLHDCFAELKKREEKCNVKMLSFIQKHWKDVCLFHTSNHPTNILIQELVNAVIGLIDETAEKIDLSGKDEILHAFVTPILPCTVKVNGIIFKPAGVRMGEKEASLEEYVEKVIKVYRSKCFMGE